MADTSTHAIPLTVAKRRKRNQTLKKVAGIKTRGYSRAGRAAPGARIAR